MKPIFVIAVALNTLLATQAMAMNAFPTVPTLWPQDGVFVDVEKLTKGQ